MGKFSGDSPKRWEMTSASGTYPSRMICRKPFGIVRKIGVRLNGSEARRRGEENRREIEFSRH